MIYTKNTTLFPKTFASNGDYSTELPGVVAMDTEVVVPSMELLVVPSMELLVVPSMSLFAVVVLPSMPLLAMVVVPLITLFRSSYQYYNATGSAQFLVANAGVIPPLP
jgi:hypothetical protein